MKLTDTVDEQAALEALVEETKPRIPSACRRLHFLLSSPFRYQPYPNGSRFRRAGLTPGVFYCSKTSTTAIAELAFYRVLFFAESPNTPWPKNASEYTGFSAALSTKHALDLEAPPLDANRVDWECLQNYSSCQDLADICRRAGAEVIKYRSVRDPNGGSNFAVLTCAAFAKPSYQELESWKLHLGPGGVRAVREFPPLSLGFPPSAFAADPRTACMRWTG